MKKHTAAQGCKDTHLLLVGVYIPLQTENCMLHWKWFFSSFLWL